MEEEGEAEEEKVNGRRNIRQEKSRIYKGWKEMNRIRPKQERREEGKKNENEKEGGRQRGTGRRRMGRQN